MSVDIHTSHSFWTFSETELQFRPQYIEHKQSKVYFLGEPCLHQEGHKDHVCQWNLSCSKRDILSPQPNQTIWTLSHRVQLEL